MSTILEVAKEAHVSAATVSRVLNESELVSPETRARVMAAIEKLDYTPNFASRNLRRQETRMILVLLSDLVNPFYGKILHGMEQRARTAGYNLLIASTNSDQLRESALLKMLEQKQADGVIFLAALMNPENLIQLNEKYPIIQCCEYLENTGISYVSIDNYAAFYQATRHLIRMGHKQLAMISSSNDFVSTRLREQAFRQALLDNNIPFTDELIRRGSYSFETGYAGTQILLRHSVRPTAILNISDTTAAGCISALCEAGLKIPEDIAVMGFDDLDIAKMLQPTLSTVHQPLTRLGYSAVDLLLERLTGVTTTREVFLPHELILRKSTM